MGEKVEHSGWIKLRNSRPHIHKDRENWALDILMFLCIHTIYTCLTSEMSEKGEKGEHSGRRIF